MFDRESPKGHHPQSDSFTVTMAAATTKQPEHLLQRWLPSPWRVFVAVFGLLAAIYAVTATWTLPYHGDALTNAVTGWYLGNEGTFIAYEHEALTAPEQHGNFSWFVESPRGPISQYPPGTALTVAPFYWLSGVPMVDTEMSGTNRPDLAPVAVPMPPFWPATLSAVVVTAAACAFLALTARQLGASPPLAMGTGVVAGLGTTAWAVASNMSWTHGPAMLAIAIATYSAARERYLLSGLALGFGVLVRPHIGVIAAALGIGLAIHMRSLRPLVRVGFGSGMGLVALLAYNYWVWGQWTVSGGYGGVFSERLLNSSLTWFVGNVAGAFFDFRHGLLPWSPFLLLLIVGAVAGWKKAPPWARSLAVGGLLYLLIQLRANRFSGGDGHFAYRYPLETLMAAGSLFVSGYSTWIRQRPVVRWALYLSISASVLFQGIGAYYT